MIKYKTINTKITPEQYEAIRKKAFDEGTSMAEVIRAIFEENLILTQQLCSTNQK